MTKKSTVIAFAAVILTASAFGFTNPALAETKTPTSWKSSQKHIKEYLKHAPGVVGTVSSINGNTITLVAKNKTIYTIDAQTAKVFKNRNTPIALTDIKVGDTIMAQGTFNGTSISATTIFDGKTIGNKKNGTFPGVMGTVSNITATSFQITTKDGSVYTVTVNADTKIHKGTPATTAKLSDILNGDMVMVRGTVTGQNVVAHTVFDGKITKRDSKK